MGSVHNLLEKIKKKYKFQFLKQLVIKKLKFKKKSNKKNTKPYYNKQCYMDLIYILANIEESVAFTKKWKKG
jgi:hypothetical protein